jgi:hypothetical protein
LQRHHISGGNVRAVFDRLARGIKALYTDKKENQMFLIYREIQSGAVAKSYMSKVFLIYED